MNENELAAAVAKLGPTTRAIYELIIKEGPIIVSRMREVTGHANGHSDELSRLRRLGLIRDAGLKPNWTQAGRPPMQYVAVPAADVEKEAKAAAARTGKPAPKRSAGPSLDREHMERLRAAEEQGHHEDYYRGRRKMVALMRSFGWFANAIDWDCVPEGEADDVLLEFQILEQQFVTAKAAILVRKGDDADKAKIAIMRDEHGRTPEEAAAFKRGAERLARKLPQQRAASATPVKKVPTLRLPVAGTVAYTVLNVTANAYPDGLIDEVLRDRVAETHPNIAANSAGLRRSELVKGGWIEKSGIKRKTVSGRPADVWRLTVAGAEKLSVDAA